MFKISEFFGRSRDAASQLRLTRAVGNVNRGYTQAMHPRRPVTSLGHRDSLPNMSATLSKKDALRFQLRK